MPAHRSLIFIYKLHFNYRTKWTDLYEPKQYIGIAQPKNRRSVLGLLSHLTEGLKKLINKGDSRHAITNTMQKPEK